ncbi:hypothetical protein PR202_ga22020 [Eleusine coracana subsp. coracana]|uniref:KIB1-4 beta-propeller domain-containing protein n=1 Tax=Eleusine coracana subsp. coracana TaxID=191504 RepID=A0AAV5D2J6_ELECO|nr:hypothetical protein PR202_ga22020 [Eleusine coracana subsp. coracana]
MESSLTGSSGKLRHPSPPASPPSWGNALTVFSGCHADAGNTFDEMLVNNGTPWSRSSKWKEMDSGAGTSGEMFDRRSHERSRLEFDAGVTPWAGLQPDILGIVLRLLPCLADRVSVRSVCRHWHAGYHGHFLPPPMPLLVRPTFRFSGLTTRGALRHLRCVPIPKEVGADHVRFVGSSDGWLVAVTPSKDRSEFCRDADEECFLLNVFTHVMVVLSASPESGSEYIVAASSYNMARQKIALWQPGMMCWHVCLGLDIGGPVDLAFYLGKLYDLQRPYGLLYAFELEEDDRGVIVSRVERCVTQPLPPHCDRCSKSCNMVVWRENLLFIIRYYSSCTMREIVKVEVFAVDFSTDPKGFIKVNNLDGDCIFVDSGGCKSFPANLHDEVKCDHIFFLRDDLKLFFVYNMRDGSMRPFAVNLLLRNIEEDNLDFPVWLFPSDAAELI